MDRRGGKGSITVFLSLSCILFLCLICTTVESARMQGARAQTANILGLGDFSVLGEFEKPLLEEYEIFSVDGAYGSGSFRISKLEEHLEKFLACNTSPKEGVFSIWCFDPWNLKLIKSGVKQYALLTDNRGEPFYQQAVSYMKANGGMLAAEALLEHTKDADTIRKWETEYEKRKKENDSRLSGLEEKKQEKLDQLESEGGESAEPALPAKESNNPLKEIAKLRKRSILELVTGGRTVSEKKLSGSLPSKSRPQEGSLHLEREHSGAVSDALFREYLMRHFPNYCSKKPAGAVDYQAEYLLGGKNTDEKNLKYVVNRLLLLREGMNYLYCLEDSRMELQAGSLALSLTGFLGIPALTEATRQALLLAWAYGESLVDVHTLLCGGKIPLWKDASSWVLTLEKLGTLTEVLGGRKAEQGEGLDYGAYLRILLNLGSLADQKMRALDLIQCNLRQKEGMEAFQAGHCIVAIRTEGIWECRSVFLGLPQAVMGLSGQNRTIEQQGSIAY